jgi:alkylated DNA repair dioxygenase AlkB
MEHCYTDLYKNLNIHLYENFLPKDMANDLYELLNCTEYNPKEKSAVIIRGRKTYIPRSQIAYGDPNTSYNFSGIQVKAKSWDSNGKLEYYLRYIRNRLESTFRYKLNFVLVNRYVNGNEYIGYHKDDEKDLGEDPKILGISLGVGREMYFKHDTTGEVIKVKLPHNSLVVINNPTNKYWKHSIPKKAKLMQTRISLTYRNMVNASTQPY